MTNTANKFVRLGVKDTDGDLVAIAFGTVEKTTQGRMTIRFKDKFAQDPIVTITPNWEENASPGHVENVCKITDSSFDISSLNASTGGNRYYVHFMAVGRVAP